MHWFLRKNNIMPITGIKKLISVLLIFILLAPLVVRAQIIRIENPIKANNFWELLDALIDVIFILSIPVGTIMFIVAGFYFITAAGDPEKITTAKKMVLYTLVGLLIVFCAKGLVALLIKVLGVGTGPSGPSLPPGVDEPGKFPIM